MYYTGWNQGGLVSIELTNPEYNPCLRRTASGGLWLEGGKGQDRTQVTFEARRTDGPVGSLRLTDAANKVEISMKELSTLGSVRDACGGVSAKANAVQFEGTGTYNGAPASFRVCAQDNGEGSKASADQFFLTCTAGCSYTASGAVGGGNISVRQN
jgi:hypothetical protein